MHATHLLYQAAHCPPLAGAEPAKGPCWLCGQDMEMGLAREDMIRDTFLDHDKIARPDSEWLCPACAWCFSEQVPMTGRDKPQRLRNYSHFVVDGAWRCLSKAEKPAMRTILLAPPATDWLGVIAVSGQKHLIFRAPVSCGNSPAVIQFEEQALTYAPEALREVLETVDALLALGFSKTEVETGHFLTGRVLKAGLATWQPLERAARSRRGSLLFQLAIFLGQKEEQ